MAQALTLDARRPLSAQNPAGVAAAPAGPASIDANDSPSSRFRILVVEDHEELRTFMIRLLQDRFDVTGAVDGVEAWDEIRRDPPDMVLADVIMPRQGGVPLLRQIRAEPELRTMPVLLISARTDDNTRLEGLESGADDFLNKPFRSRELLARVTSQLELVRVRRESAAQVAAVARQLSLQLDDMRQLHQFSERLSGVQPVDCMLQEVLEAALSVHGTQQGLLSLQENDRLEIAASRGFRAEVLELIRQARNSGPPCERAVAERRRIVVVDFESDPAYEGIRTLARAAGVRAAHATPMITRSDKVIGTLTVFFPQSHFPTERERQLMDLYARQAADLIDAAQLRERVETELAERRRAESALRDSDEWLRLATATGGVGLWDWDVRQDRMRWTDPVYEMHGVPRDQFKGTVSGVLELIHPDDRSMVERTLQRALRDKLAFDVEYRVQRPDGRTVWLLTRGSVLTEDGRTVRILGGTLDNTSRRQADETARFLAAIVESSEDAIYSKDANNVITSWNASAERLLGYSAHEIIGQSADLLIPPNCFEIETRVEEHIRRGERVSLFESIRRTHDGGLIPVAITISPIKDASGRVIGASKIVRDITARQRAEEALRTSEERFRTLADHAPVGIFLSNAQGECIFVNQSWCRMTGLAPDQAHGAGWHSVIHPTDRERVERFWQEAAERPVVSTCEYRTIGTGGELSWWETRAVPFRHEERFIGHLGICIDVTGHKRAELNANFLQQLSEEVACLTSPEEIVRAAQTRVGVHLDVDRVWFLDARPDEPRVRTPGDWHRPDLVPLDAEQLSDQFASPEMRELLSGTRNHVDDVRSHPLLGAVADPLLAQSIQSFAVAAYWRSGDWVGTLIVTARRPRNWRSDELAVLEDTAVRIWPLIEQARVREQLRESGDRNRRLLASLPVACYTLDASGHITFFNDAAVALWGRTPEPGEQWCGSTAMFTADGTRLPLEQCPAAVALREQRGQRGMEAYVMRPDGTLRWVSPYPEPIHDGEGRCVGLVNVVVDVTHQREVEKELKRARDEALAASQAKDDFLAALSHELRTPLSPVLLLASDSAANQALPAEIRAQFETIRSNVDLEARLIDDLLDLTRIARGKTSLERRVLDLHQVLNDALSTVRTEQAAKGITLELSLDATVSHVRGDAVRLQQVFWNILKNAVKFTPANGRITVASRTAPGGESITVEITDTGLGMTAGEIARVFDAFTQGEHGESSGTHPYGGLGLGLAISQKLLEQHDGRIWAVSPGRDRGSSFFIELPLTSPSPLEVSTVSPFPASPSALSPDHRGDNAVDPLRILLVEDHQPTRLTLEALLQRRGHQVAAAADLASAREHAARTEFDLLVSDVGLPDGDGHDLFAELRLQQPSLLGIALSGYGMGDDLHRSQAAGFSAHLVKPVSIDALDEAIRRVSRTSRAF